MFFPRIFVESIVQKCKLVDGDVGRCVCELTVEEEHQNPAHALHGGMTATLVDIVSTAALLTTEQAKAGVSVDLNVSWASFFLSRTTKFCEIAPTFLELIEPFWLEKII